MSDPELNSNPSNSQPSPPAWPPPPQTNDYQPVPASLLPAFLPIASIARWTLGLLWVGLVLNVAGVIVGLIAIKYGNTMLFLGILTALSALELLVLLACCVTFLIWVYRTYGNLRAFGATGLSSSPGWAVGYYFIPILWFYKPYQLMNETWKASEPGLSGSPASTDWRKVRSSAVVVGWWIGWLAWNLVSGVVGASAIQQPTASVDLEGQVISDASFILSSLFAILLVPNLTKRQEEAARRLAAS